MDFCRLLRYSREMLFLHTSDWHLGKSLYETSLLEDQRFFLGQLTEHMQRQEESGEPYSALIVAGDIYDKAVPGPEAVSLLSSFLSEVKCTFPRLHVFLIPGNHDSAARLSFAADILASQNIHIAADARRCDIPVIVESNGERAAVYQIPFLTPLCLSSSSGAMLRRQDELAGEACERILARHREQFGNLPCVAAAHLFTDGSGIELSGSESGFAGNVEKVSVSHFRGFDYVALGHIHRKQSCGSSSVWYSGSPLPYSFGEQNDKSVLRVSVSAGHAEVEPVGIRPLHPLVRLEGTFDSFLNAAVSDAVRNSYVEIVCTDGLEHEHPAELLRPRFANLLSFRMKRPEGEGLNRTIEERRKVVENLAADDYGVAFELFMKELYGDSGELDSQLYKDEKALFEQIAREAVLEELK